jgi:Zeta toxin
VVGAAVEKEGPWIVFTAGAMGAGKSHVIHWMSQRGSFPLPDIVQIDPDLFKCGFPEWESYVAHSPLEVSELMSLLSLTLSRHLGRLDMGTGSNLQWVIR